MCARQFEKQSGYDLWHGKLAHASNWNIWDTIKWAIGLESLKNMTFETHARCPSSMVGKATLEDFPKAIRPINKPLYQVHIDSFSSSVKWIEVYLHAIVFVDATTGYQWIYEMKTKEGAIKVLRRWYSKFADLRIDSSQPQQNLVFLIDIILNLIIIIIMF